MGNWKLEVFKLGLYISFPVGLFYVFNQPKYFEEWVVKTRHELYPPIDEESRRHFKEVVTRRKRLQMEKELLKKLNEIEG
ncbi:hypothetical protein CEXT_278141 [Caerostris extrusa]|uniref:Protein PET100 homolog, mitochondrial n=1 Tax=Caerostris extrusa TaxID=172846 RepID=A0AAV4Q7U6_CAEEX|nr:hypothetical protein CEXT_278141 [Caerostris extrusa]